MHIYYQFPNSDEGDFIYVDAAVRETHAAQSEITRLPVERGFDLTDHSRPQPIELSIEGVISNHPLPRVLDIAGTPGANQSVELEHSRQNVTAYRYPTNMRRAETEYQRLLFVKDAGYLCDMVTSLTRYENMAIESVNVSRDVHTANAVHFTMSAVQIFVAETQLSEVRRPKEKRGKKTKDAGTQPTQEVTKTEDETEKSQSIFSSLSGIGKAVS